MKPGDKVAYGWQFLESIGMSHSDMSHARGEILVLQEHKSWKTIKAVEEVTFSEPKTTEGMSGNMTE